MRYYFKIKFYKHSYWILRTLTIGEQLTLISLSQLFKLIEIKISNCCYESSCIVYLLIPSTNDLTQYHEQKSVYTSNIFGLELTFDMLALVAQLNFIQGYQVIDNI